MSDNTIFSGNSRYANDFSQVVNRSIAIASLPLQQLNNQKSTLTDESSALTGLQTNFSRLQSALNSWDAAVGNSQFTAIPSEAGVANTKVTSSALAGDYTLQVVSLGTASTALSKQGLTTVTDPAAGSITQASNVTLSIDGVGHSLTLSGNTLNDLAAAINQDSSLGVRATIVNVGSNGARDYRLSLQSKEYGAHTIQISDGSDLLDTVVTGSPVTYRLNQQSVDITSNSRTVEIAPGLTVDLLAERTTTISVQRTTAALSGAISNFVDAYNGTVDALDAQHGQAGGPLRGHAIVSTLQQNLSKVASFFGSGDVGSLADLGLSFNEKGKLSFDADVLAAAASAHPDSVSDFLGRASDGGFLKNASDLLDGITDSTNGVLSASISSMKESLQRQDQLIASAEDRVTQLRDSLTARLNAADAAIAALEQQVTYITSLFGLQNGNNK